MKKKDIFDVLKKAAKDIRYYAKENVQDNSYEYSEYEGTRFQADSGEEWNGGFAPDGSEVVRGDDDRVYRCRDCGEPIRYKDGRYFCHKCGKKITRLEFFRIYGIKVAGLKCYSCDVLFPGCSHCHNGYDVGDEYDKLFRVKKK